MVRTSAHFEEEEEEVELMQPRMMRMLKRSVLVVVMVVVVVPRQLQVPGHLNQAVHSANSAGTHQAVAGSAFAIDVLEWELWSGCWWRWLMMMMMRQKWSLLNCYYSMAAESGDGHW